MKTLNEIIRLVNKLSDLEKTRLLKLIAKAIKLRVSSDEELNTIYSKFEIAQDENKIFIIFGLSGSEENEW